MVSAREILSAWTLITVCPTVGNTLCAPRRNMASLGRPCSRRNIKNKPVNPGVRNSVPILHNKNETFGFCRQVSKLEWRTDVFSIACVGSGNAGEVRKFRTCNKHEKLLSYQIARQIEGQMFSSDQTPALESPVAARRRTL